MSSTSVVRRDDERGVAWLTLDRADSKNALSPAITRELCGAFEQLGADPDVRVVAITGAGDTFSAGADLVALQEMADAPYARVVEDAWANERLFRSIDSCPHPVVARVNGAAVGGGVGIVACSDIAVASSRARFGFGEVRVGIAPAVISTYVVPKIGLSAARRFMVTGERFGAETAKQIGLVHEVADPEELDDAVEAVIAQLCAAWPGAQRVTKALLSKVWAADQREAYVAAAMEAGLAARTSEEGRLGIAEFLARSRDRGK